MMHVKKSPCSLPIDTTGAPTIQQTLQPFLRFDIPRGGFLNNAKN